MLDDIFCFKYFTMSSLHACFTQATHLVIHFCSHHNIWRDAGVPERLYRYYDPATKGLAFEGLMEDIQVRYE